MELVNKFTQRAATTTAAAMLAVGAPVAIAPSAEASTVVTNQYTCQDARGPSFPVEVTTEVTGWEDRTTAPAGTGPYPAGTLSFHNHFTVPADARTYFADRGAQTIEVEEMTLTWSGPSDASIGTDVIREYAPDLRSWPKVAFESMTENPDGTYSFDDQAIDAPSDYPQAGEHDLLSPTWFNLYSADGTGSGGRCTLVPGTTPAALLHLRVIMSDSTTTARPTHRSVGTGDPVVVKAQVTVPSESSIAPQGAVRLRDKHGHILDRATLYRSKVELRTARLPVGKNVLKVVYQGDGNYHGSKTTVVVQVTRR